MDTRAKIISAEEARDIAAGKKVHWFSGHFDPLLAEHAAMVHSRVEAGRLLIVEVTNGTRPLLAQRARAELVAALAEVDYVVLGEHRAKAPDEEINGRFIAHVELRANGRRA